MSDKLIPNKFLMIYDLYDSNDYSKFKFGKGFTIQDVIVIMDMELEAMDKFHPNRYWGENEGKMMQLRNFIKEWYKKDKIFEKQYRLKIEKAENEIPEYMDKFHKLRLKILKNKESK
ncbi:MAG: hypothetical protein PF485_09445 [Bacteroidales bacterium]|jgi:hypothetical protein|nr:hypothetical protein [Bacteroidales bacterium]